MLDNALKQEKAAQGQDNGKAEFLNSSTETQHLLQGNADDNNKKKLTPLWQRNLRDFCIQFFDVLRGAASGTITTFFIAAIISTYFPVLTTLAPAVLFALPLGAVIGVSAFALYRFGLENRFKQIIPNSDANAQFSGVASNLSFKQQLRNIFVHGVSWLAALLEGASVFYSCFKITLALAALGASIISPLAMATCVAISVLLAVGGFAASFFVTAPAIRAVFKVKDSQTLANIAAHKVREARKAVKDLLKDNNCIDFINNNPDKPAVIKFKKDCYNLTQTPGKIIPVATDTNGLKKP